MYGAELQVERSHCDCRHKRTHDDHWDRRCTGELRHPDHDSQLQLRFCSIGTWTSHDDVERKLRAAGAYPRWLRTALPHPVAETPLPPGFLHSAR